MNRNKIKFKYLMNLWKSLPSYPTQEDVIYELCSYLEKDGRPNGEFTLQTFNSIWGSKWVETKQYELVQQMFNAGLFIESSGQGSNKVKYKIKDIPEYI
jgi:hypothetical protein